MKPLCVGLCALVLVLGAVAPGVHSRNLLDLDKPMELNAGKSPRMFVTFNHSSHKGTACRVCHHAGLPGKRYAPCANPVCHSLPGPAERDPMSVYMAYHAPDIDRSCYGCHKKLAGKHPGFKGCQPCHMTPQSRKLAAEKTASGK